LYRNSWSPQITIGRPFPSFQMSNSPPRRLWPDSSLFFFHTPFHLIALPARGSVILLDLLVVWTFGFFRLYGCLLPSMFWSLRCSHRLCSSYFPRIVFLCLPSPSRSSIPYWYPVDQNCSSPPISPLFPDPYRGEFVGYCFSQFIPVGVLFPDFNVPLLHTPCLIWSFPPLCLPFPSPPFLVRPWNPE